MAPDDCVIPTRSSCRDLVRFERGMNRTKDNTGREPRTTKVRPNLQVQPCKKPWPSDRLSRSQGTHQHPLARDYLDWRPNSHPMVAQTLPVTWKREIHDSLRNSSFRHCTRNSFPVEGRGRQTIRAKRDSAPHTGASRFMKNSTKLTVQS